MAKKHTSPHGKQSKKHLQPRNPPPWFNALSRFLTGDLQVALVYDPSEHAAIIFDGNTGRQLATYRDRVRSLFVGKARSSFDSWHLMPDKLVSLGAKPLQRWLDRQERKADKLARQQTTRPKPQSASV
jgi:hypothetical protein